MMRMGLLEVDQVRQAIPIMPDAFSNRNRGRDGGLMSNILSKKKTECVRLAGEEKGNIELSSVIDSSTRAL